jgi:hypothetical protein
MAPRSSTRRLRLGGAIIAIVAVIAVAGYGALQLVAPGGTRASPSGSGVAQASSSPSDLPATPAPAVSFTLAETAQIAFCLALQETHGLDADVASVRAAVTALDHATVATEGAALVVRVAEMRLAAREMMALPFLAAYAAAYDTGLKGVGAAASALTTAGGSANGKAEAKASAALATAQTKLHASDAQRTSLTVANPLLSCNRAQ